MAKLKNFPKQDIELNTRLYDEYIHEYHMLNGWHPGNQLYNFRALSRLADMTGVPFRDATVLDVGCGTGDLLTFLKNNRPRFYVGVDIYKPSLDVAKKQFPNEKFLEGDILTLKFKEPFDYAICSGALTVNVSVDNYDYLESMVSRMWKLTRIGLAFNVLTEDPDPDSDLFFYNPERVLQICHDIDPSAVLGAEETPDVAQIHVYMYRDK